LIHDPAIAEWPVREISLLPTDANHRPARLARHDMSRTGAPLLTGDENPAAGAVRR
jgi:hypothetical protein